MQILEELGTFIVSVALAVALLGVAAVLLYYFNPQQPVDHAKAAFYPLVKPLNKTHVWLGVKPSADKVEVVELKYQYRGRWADIPVARLTADRAVWLNTTDGRPVAVPCSANVTVATRYGTASRAVSFTPVCLQRHAQFRDDLTVLVEQMASYGSYVLDYVAYKSTPVLTAYFGFGLHAHRLPKRGALPLHGRARRPHRRRPVAAQLSTPNGTFYVEEPLRGTVPEGFRQVVYIYAEGPYAVALGFEYRKVSGRYYWVPFVHSSDDMACWFRGNWPYSGVLCRVLGRWSVEIAWSIDSNGVVSVYRGGAFQRRTRLGQLSAALAWIPDGRMYAASPTGMASDTTRVSAPFAYRWSLSGAYNYTLTLSIAADRELISSWTFGSTTYYLYNVTYRGVMNLTYNEPVALDAFYGWYYMLYNYTPPPPPPEPPGPIPRPEDEGSVSFCTPTRVKIDEDQEHRELNKGSNGYSVQVVNYAIIRVTGCGYDYTYKEVTSVTTLTADGNIYQVTDDKGNVCGFGQARTCDDGVVRCECEGDEQSG
jgi:hypothetical protein